VSRPFVALLTVVLLAAPSAARAKGAATAPTRTIDAAGVRLAYRSIGSGRPIVFVMGLGGTMDAWEPGFLDRVAAQGRRVIVFDNEGVGKSKLRSGTLTIRRMGDDTAALIKALELRQPDVFGWSMGGMIAQSFAVRHPGSVRRLVLAATAPGDKHATFPQTDILGALASPAGNPARALGLLFPDGTGADAQRYATGLAKRPNLNVTVPQPILDAQVAASGTWLFGNDPDGAKVKRLKMPVLVGGGERDTVLPVANQRHLASVIPGAERAIYPGMAHGFWFQAGERFADRMDRFLDRR
jgi:pimeloyl-ACP methyl ester carboxylesterase